VFEITNTSSTNTAQVISTSLASETPADWSKSSDGCFGQVLQPLESCEIDVTFAPQAAIGEEPADLEVAGPSNFIDIPLTGSGVTGVLTSTESSLNFGSTTQSNPLELEADLTNADFGTELTSAPNITGPNAGDFQIAFTNCSTESVLNAGNGCAIGVTYTPSVLGPETATLVIPSDASNAPVTVPLTGTGLSGPAVSFNTDEADLGNVLVGDSADQVVTLTNSGDSPLNISNDFIFSGATPVFPILHDTCLGATIAPSDTCTVDIGFSPTVAGAQFAQLSFITNASPSLSSVGVTGTGTVPPTPPTPVVPPVVTPPTTPVVTTPVTPITTTPPTQPNPYALSVTLAPASSKVVHGKVSLGLSTTKPVYGSVKLYVVLPPKHKGGAIQNVVIGQTGFYTSAKQSLTLVLNKKGQKLSKQNYKFEVGVTVRPQNNDGTAKTVYSAASFSKGGKVLTVQSGAVSFSF
jgi:hypothetical protein